MAAARVSASPRSHGRGAGRGQRLPRNRDLGRPPEEFVGEIQDEQDVGELPPIMHGAEGRFEADGRLTLDVAERELGVILPPLRPDIETLGAYVQAHLGHPLRPAAPLTWWISLHSLGDSRRQDSPTTRRASAT